MGSSVGEPEEIDGYVEQVGPGIPELAVGELPPPGVEEDLSPEQAAALFPGWEQETVEQFLKGAGHGLHMLLGAGEKAWLMTDTDLDRIAPPLTRILNRYEPTLRASEYADPLLVAYGVGLYSWRSVLQRQAALRARSQARQDGYVDATADEDAVVGEPEIEVEEYIPYADRRSQ